MHLDDSLMLTWAHLVAADVLLTSRSTFSWAPAVGSSAVIVLKPPTKGQLQSDLPNWMHWQDTRTKMSGLWKWRKELRARATVRCSSAGEEVMRRET